MKALPYWKRLSLQITIPIVVTALLILSALSYYLISVQQDEAFERAELELRSMVVVAQGSLNRMFSLDRTESVTELLSEVHVHPRVKQAVILSPSGELRAFYAANQVAPELNKFIAELPREQILNAARSGVTSIEYHAAHKHFVAVVPVLPGSQLSTELSRNLFVVEYYHDNTWYQLNSMAMNELMAFISVILVVGLMLWTGLQFLIARPVKTLVQALDRFADREIIGTLNVPSYNELGLLADALLNAAHSREDYEARLRTLTAAVEQSSDSIVITDLNARIEYVNKAFTDISGYSADDVIGSNLKILASGNTSKTTYEAMWKVLTAGQVWQGELYNLRKDGSEYREWATISPLRDEHGEIKNYLASKQNITERRAAEEQVHHLAFFDVLTGLPNRPHCTQILREMLSSRDARKFGVVVLFDVDGLQRINDVRGFEFGDQILLSINERLSQVLNYEHDAKLGNLGGDLFAFILPARGEREHIIAHSKVLVKEALDEIARPVIVSGENVTVTASAGMVVYPEYGDTAESIIRHAETAVHNAKDAGGNQLIVYNPAYSYELEQRFEIERELRAAIGSDQLKIYVQPQQLADGTFVGVEVLCRWHHPELGAVSPVVFIPIAEKTDLIVDLGKWILAEALEVLARLPGDLTLAINISPRQFRKFDFIYYIERQLLRTGADPKRLILEVTENLLVDDVQDITLKMKTLKETGVQFSIDDFGTGYSSLSYLTNLPLDELKIDQSFVQGIGDVNKEKIVETVVSMGEHLGLRIVAEGVETKQQLNFLTQLSCEVVSQGYYFFKPMPVDDFFAELKNRPQQLPK
ncbi:putative bifunctional diguanylate cyclase/phosphodiesterase [Pseudidiomarina sp.]|uniref:putative bifunctional diguanylate cyclase/phosphodiesterase n=1 Tax=Pseudidiomarina sp. TaxID=2081707 RepID=UPI003A9846CC